MAGSVMVPATILGPVMWRVADRFEEIELGVNPENGYVVVAEWYCNGKQAQYIVQVHTDDEELFITAMEQITKNVQDMRDKSESIEYATIH